MSDEEAETADAAGEEREPSVVFIDPELTQESADEIGAALEMPVSRLDLAELGGDPSADLTERTGLGDALAVVVAWDLGGHTALDVVESLRQTERAVDAPIVVASSEPTRGQVTAALRAGASSFAHRPYDAEELRVRLRTLLEPEAVSA